MSDKMNMVIKGVASDDIYGEALAVEIHFVQADGSDLYVMCDSAAGDFILSVSPVTQIPVYANTANDESLLLERHEFTIREEDTYGNVKESAYYKAYDLAAYIWENADWTALAETVAALGSPYIGKNIDDIEYTGTLEEMMYPTDEDEDGYDC